MIHLADYLYEAELNLGWWNSKSLAYQKRYLNKHPNSIYAQKVKDGELEVGGDDNELFEESNSVFTIDGKQKEFSYVSSFNKDSIMYSFAQDNLGLWWYFTRTGITSGKNLQGPFRSKEKLLSVIS